MRKELWVREMCIHGVDGLVKDELMFIKNHWYWGLDKVNKHIHENKPFITDDIYELFPKEL